MTHNIQSVRVAGTHVAILDRFHEKDLLYVVLAAIGDRTQSGMSTDSRVLLLGGPKSPQCLEAERLLSRLGYWVTVRDDDYLGDGRRTPTDLVREGEFRDCVGVVTFGPAGVIGAMKALGVTYLGMEQDAELIQSTRRVKELPLDDFSPVGRTLAQGLQALAYNPGPGPEELAVMKTVLLASFVHAVENRDEERLQAQVAGLRAAAQMANCTWLRDQIRAALIQVRDAGQDVELVHYLLILAKSGSSLGNAVWKANLQRFLSILWRTHNASRAMKERWTGIQQVFGDSLPQYWRQEIDDDLSVLGRAEVVVADFQAKVRLGLE